MASQKLLLQLALLAVCAAAFVTAAVEERMSLPKTVIVGYREPQDRLIEREVIRKQAQFLSYVRYEKTFVGNNHSIITQIRIIDLDTKGNGAIAKVTTGGPGDSFVTVSFKSLLNRGINFSVEIYAKEPAGEQ